MTTLLERVVGTFYAAPQTVDRPEERSCVSVVPAVAVLARAEDVTAAGAAVGLAVARECRAPAAVVCVWTGDESTPGRLYAPASAAAHRLAEALARRGHTARASRRLVFVALPAQEAVAVAQSARVSAAAGAAPVVLALGGARGEGFDAALTACDLVVIASSGAGDPALASLALAGVEAMDVPAVRCEAPAAPFARLLAAMGVGLSPSARASIGQALEVLR